MSIFSKTKTDSGEVSHAATVSQDTNGQTVVKIESRLGQAIHTHAISLGAANGDDAIGQMGDDQIAITLQASLDSLRASAATFLSNRARVARLAANLK